MDRVDFRHHAVIESHAQLVRFVVRKQITYVEAAKMAVLMGDALVDALTVEEPANQECPNCDPSTNWWCSAEHAHQESKP